MSEDIRFRSFPDGRGSGPDAATYERIRAQAAEFIRAVGADKVVAVAEHSSGPGMLTVTVWHRSESAGA